VRASLLAKPIGQGEQEEDIGQVVTVRVAHFSHCKVEFAEVKKPGLHI